MKIVHVVHGYLPEHDGGTERYVHRLAHGQLALGHEVYIVAGTIRAEFDGLVECDPEPSGPRVFRISQKGVWAERWDHGDQPEIELALARFVEEQGIELVHVHHWLRLSRGIVRAARSVGRPVVVTAHDLTTTCPRLFRVREDAPFCERSLNAASCVPCVPREAAHSDEVIAASVESYRYDMSAELRASSAVVVPSVAHRDVIARFTDVEANSMHVIAHPRLEDALARDRANDDDTIRMRVAHWGYHVDFKGQHVLLDALERLDRGAEIELVFWGSTDDVEYRTRLDAALDRLRDRGVVIDRQPDFSRDDLANLSADVAVFPSLAHESWSFVVDEALGLGIPVLVSDSGAPRERIGDAGLAFPTGDADVLAACLQSLLDDRARIATMRASCHSAGLDIERHLERLHEVYGRVLRSPVDFTAIDFEARIHAATLRRALEVRMRQLGALYRSCEEDLRGTRQDAQDAFRLAIRNEQP